MKLRLNIVPGEQAPCPKESLTAFMQHLYEVTLPNPIGDGRVFQNSALLSVEIWGGTIWLREVRVWEYRNGNGSRALQFLCTLADNYGVTIRLTPKPIGAQGMRANDLRKWYRRFGFLRVEHGVMRRLPVLPPVTKVF